MGIVQRQTIKGTIFSYLGTIIGFINLVLLMPILFTSDQIGLTQVIVAIATILAQFGNLGFNNVTNRLFPYFRNENNTHNGYLSLAFIVSIFGYLICFIGINIYMPYFVEANQAESELLSKYAFHIPALLGLMMLISLLDNYCKVLFNAVIGTFLKEIVMRILILVFLFCFKMGIINFDQYVFLFIYSYLVPITILIVYLIVKREFRFGSFKGIMTKSLRRSIIILSVYGIIAGLSGIAVTSIDKYMINNLVGLGEAGIYSIAVYFATLILIPARALTKIAVPVVSESWKNKDLENINIIYYKSSINQLLIGLLILVGILANLNNIFRILPDEYKAGEIVILIFCLTNLLTVSVGAARIILATSSKFRYQTYLMILLIILVVITNLIFIPLYGMAGAAIASFASTFIYLSITIIVLRLAYGLWPFGSKHLYAVILAFLTYLLISLVPELNLVPDIIIRSVLIICIFSLGVRFLKLSSDWTGLVDESFGIMYWIFRSRRKNNS